MLEVKSDLCTYEAKASPEENLIKNDARDSTAEPRLYDKIREVSMRH